MTMRELSDKVRPNGEWTTWSIIPKLNSERPVGSDKITDTKLCKLLRRAGFLMEGKIKKPTDPSHNKPHQVFVKMGWARKEITTSFCKHKNRDIEYYAAIITPAGYEEVKKIAFNPDHTVWNYVYEHEKPKPATKPTHEQKFNTAKAHQENMAAIKKLVNF